MHLVIKGIKGESQTIDVPEDSSILDLKAIIMSQLGHPVPNQKLLYKGKILDDSKLIPEYGIKEGETLVIMVTKTQEPSQFEKDVQVLIQMGVDRAEAEEVLRSLDNDLEKAKKYFIAQSMEEDDSENDEENLAQTSGTFDFLLNSQEFLNIRDILRQNPNEFESLMTQLAVGNRDLYELIKSNIDEFLAVIGLRRRTEERIEISENEEVDIKELCELGFNEQDVFEAYLACGKNKELAASYLFENYEQKFD